MKCNISVNNNIINDKSRKSKFNFAMNLLPSKVHKELRKKKIYIGSYKYPALGSVMRYKDKDIGYDWIIDLNPVIWDNYLDLVDTLYHELAHIYLNHSTVSKRKLNKDEDDANELAAKWLKDGRVEFVDYISYLLSSNRKGYKQKAKKYLDNYKLFLVDELDRYLEDGDISRRERAKYLDASLIAIHTFVESHKINDKIKGKK